MIVSCMTKLANGFPARSARIYWGSSLYGGFQGNKLSLLLCLRSLFYNLVLFHFGLAMNSLYLGNAA